MTARLGHYIVSSAGLTTAIVLMVAGIGYCIFFAEPCRPAAVASEVRVSEQGIH